MKNRQIKQKSIPSLRFAWLMPLLLLGVSAIGQVTVKTRVPQQALQVGINQQSFAVVINNTGATAAATTGTLSITAGTGVAAVGQVTLNQYSKTGAILWTGTAAYNNGAIALSPARSLAAGDSLVYKYTAAASTAAIGGVSPTKNNLSFAYTLGGVAQTTTAVSDPYGVIWPQMQVTAAATLNTNVFQQQNIDVVVRNSAGAGSSMAVQVNTAFPTGMFTINSITVSNGTQSVTLPATSTSFQLDQGIFNQLGLGSSFDAGEAFTVRYGTTTRTYASLSEIRTTATAVINATPVAATQSVATTNVSQPQPQPNVDIVRQLFTNTVNYCDRIGVYRVVLRNTGNSPALDYTIIHRQDFVTNQIFTGIQSITGVTLPYNTTTGLGIITSNPDGAGGFSDVDGDSDFNDIAPGDSVVLLLQVAIPPAILNDPTLQLYRLDTRFLSVNGQQTDNYLSGLLDGLSNFVTTVDLPCSIDAANQAYPMLFSFNSWYYNSLWGARNYLVRCTVPSGFQINNSSASIDIPLTDPIGYATNYNQTVSPTITASATAPNGRVPVQWQVIARQPGCSTEVVIATVRDTTINYANTSTPPAGATVTQGTTVLRRVNAGYILAQMPARPWLANQRATFPRFTEANCPNPQTFMQGDTMRVQGSIQVTPVAACSINQISVTYSYDGQQLFTPFSASITIGGTTSVLPIAAVTTSVGTKTTHRLLYTLPSPITASTSITYNILNRTAINQNLQQRIRVEAGARDCNNNTISAHTSCFNVQFSESAVWFWAYEINTCRHRLIVEGSPQNPFPSEYRPIAILQNVQITQTGLSYQSTNIPAKYNTIAATLTGTVASNVLTIPLNGILHDPRNDDDTINIPINSLCYNGQGTINSRLNYQNLGTNLPANSPSDASTTNINRFVITTTGTAQPKGNAVEWTLDVQSLGKATNGATIEIAPAATNSNILTINQVVCNGTILTPTATNGRFYVTLPLIATGVHATVLVRGTVNNCLATGTTSAIFRMAVSCQTVTPATFNGLACDLYTRTLSFQNNAFAMLPSAPTGSQAYYNLCDVIPYTVRISPNNADSANMSFWFNLPANVNVSNNTVAYQYGTVTGTLNTTSDNLSTQLNRIISTGIIQRNNMTNWQNNALTLSFGAWIGCSGNSSITDITKAVNFTVARNNRCGVSSVEAFSFSPKIRGFERLDSIKITASAVGFTPQAKGTISVTATNLFPSLVDSVNLRAVLPAGVEFVKGSTSINEFDAVTDTKLANGTTEVIWAFKRGQHLKGSEKLTFTFQVTNGLPCSTDSAYVKLYSMLQRKVKGCTATETCLLQATSDSTKVGLKRLPPQLISTVVAPISVCQGKLFTVTPTSVLSSTVFSYTLTPATAGTVSVSTTGVATVQLAATFTGKLPIKITAKNGCSQDSSISVTVTPSTVAVITTPAATVASSSPIITLAATPAGTWTGTGVSGTQFNPANAALGANTLTYTPSGACPVANTVKITVTADCNPSLSADSVFACQTGAVIVPIRTSKLFACPDCNTDNIFLSVQIDTTQLEFKGIDLTGSMLSTFAPVAYANRDKNIITIQLYTGQQQKISGAGLLASLKFNALKTGTLPITFIKAYRNGDGTSSITSLKSGKVVIGTKPSITLASTAATCQGVAVTLTPTVLPDVATNTYKWLLGTTNVASTKTASVLTAGIYTFSVTDKNGCSNTATTTVSVNAKPVVSALGGAFCAGGSFTATSSVTSGTSPYTYKWSNAATTATTTVTSAGTYTLSVTDSKGCVATTSAIVISNQLPIVTVNSGSFCAGSSFTATSSVTSGTSPYTYKWSNAATTASIPLTSAGTYTLSVTDAKNCIGTASSVVTSNPLPVVTVNSGSFCAGSSFIATSNVTSGTSPYTYKWSNAATTASTSITSAGTYTLSVTDAKNCIKTASSVVTSNPLPVVSAKGGAFCAGGSFTATSSVTSGTSPYAYKWSNAATTASITVSSANTYTLSVTDAKNCVGTDTAIVSLNALPLLPIITGDSTANSTDVKPYSVPAQTNAIFTWSGSGASIASGQGTTAITAQFSAIPATISVFATSNGCVSPTANKTIKAVVIQNIGDSVICMADAFEWHRQTMTVPNAKAGATYSWSVVGGKVETAQGTTATIVFDQGAGLVTFTITETLNSVVTTYKYKAMRYIRPASGVTSISGISNGSICKNQKNVILTASGIAPSYFWKSTSDAVIVAGQNTPQANINFGSISGNIIVYAQNGTGCLEYSGATLWINTIDCTPVNTNLSFTATVSPNPVHTDLTITASTQLQNYVISTIDGKQVLTGTLNGSTQATISVAALSNLSYMITLYSTAGGVHTEQFVKN